MSKRRIGRWVGFALGSLLVVACGGEDPSSSGSSSTGAGGAGDGGTSSSATMGGGGTTSGTGGMGPGAGGTGGAGGSAPLDGLVALYTFDGTGSTVLDVSGVDPALDLEMYGSGVTRIDSGVKLTLDDHPIIVSNGPADKVIQAFQASDAFTIEVWSKADVVDQTGPGRMLTLSVKNHRTNFGLLHGPADCGSHDFGNFYQVRVLNVGEDNGCPEVQPAAMGQVTTSLTHVVFTHDSDGQQFLYVDGQVSAQDVDTDTSLDHWFTDTPLGLGNQPNDGQDATIRDTGRGWQGELHTVALYDRALSAAEVLAHYQSPIER